MVLELEERAILFALWERGLFEDNKYYKTAMDITGLKEKEIDRWVKFQRSGSSNLNIPGVRLAPEIYLDLTKMKRERPDEEKVLSFQIDTYRIKKNLTKRPNRSAGHTNTQYLENNGPSQGEASRSCGEKRKRFRKAQQETRPSFRRGNAYFPSTPKFGFTEKQQNVLFEAWEKGFLCENKNYDFFTRITGLSQKLIKSWVKMLIRARGGTKLPPMAATPLNDCYKDFTDMMSKDEEEPGFPNEHYDGGEQRRTTSRHLRGDRLPAQSLFSQSAHPDREYIFCTDLEPESFPSPSFCAVEQMLKGIDEIDDSGLERLKNLSGCSSSTILNFMEKNGWTAIPRKKGMFYSRVKMRDR